MDLAQASHEALHDVRCTESVSETRVSRTGESEAGQAKLADAPQTLHLSGLEEFWHDGRVIALERDQSVDGVSQKHDLNLLCLCCVSSSKSPMAWGVGESSAAYVAGAIFRPNDVLWLLSSFRCEVGAKGL